MRFNFKYQGDEQYEKNYFIRIAVSIFALSSTKEENQKRKEAAFKKVNNIKTTNTNKNILMERLGYYKK